MKTYAAKVQTSNRCSHRCSYRYIYRCRDTVGDAGDAAAVKC